MGICSVLIHPDSKIFVSDPEFESGMMHTLSNIVCLMNSASRDYIILKDVEYRSIFGYR